LHTVQRWRNGSTRYRPAHETINPLHYEVAELATDTQAKQFILEHHYSASYPSARFRFGLFRHGALVGVAVFSHPCSDKVLTNVFPGAAKDSVELGRFVLLDDVPGNGETWFLGQTFRPLKRAGLRGVLAFSDPVPRATHTGDVIFRGHIGTIYQAHNGSYLGRATARRLRLLPDGRVLSDRAIQKIRAGEQGWRYSAQLLEQFGADRCPERDRQAWLTAALAVYTKPLRHPGNHRYAWSFERRHKLASQSYPKAA
jgi:hypothetical protein